MLNKRYISTDGKVFKPLSPVVRIVTLEPGWKLFYIVNILKKKPEQSKSQSCKKIKIYDMLSKDIASQVFFIQQIQ